MPPIPISPRPLTLALAAACLLVPAQALAESDVERAREDRIAELERKVDVLAEELERARSQSAVPDDSSLESSWGLGPAASKVYAITRGLSIGGYAEARYTGYVRDKGDESNEFDFVRAVLYAGYRFTDRILFNSEIEFEHASTGEDGSVSLEFATLDFLLHPAANARVGLMLLPMGFINEMHEPPFYYGNHRPEVERRIIPSTWRENGAGLFGELFGQQLTYKVYAVTGFDATGFSPSGLRGGRQKGSKSLAEDFAFVGRLDWQPWHEVLLGGSVYVGNSGQDQNVGGVAIPDSLVTIFEVHTEIRRAGLAIRGLFTKAYVDDADDLTLALQATGDLDDGSVIGSPAEFIADEMLGGYAEVGYDVWQWISPASEMTLEPFYRFELVDTQFEVASGFSKDRSERNEIHTLGLSFKPIPNVVLKADYRNRKAREGGLADEINLGMGLVF
jgi:hypothetical protein